VNDLFKAVSEAVVAEALLHRELEASSPPPPPLPMHIKSARQKNVLLRERWNKEQQQIGRQVNLKTKKKDIF